MPFLGLHRWQRYQISKYKAYEGLLLRITGWYMKSLSTENEWFKEVGLNASGGSQPRNDEGASHFARRGKNAEAFLML